MKILKVFWSAILAGLAIGLGGTVFLSVDSKVVGALLFATGLFMICAQGWHLYTGKIGTLCDQKPSYLLELLVIWLGNLVGACGLGFLLSLTRSGTIAERAVTVCAAKTNDSVVSILILSILCGFLVQAAVWLYRTATNPLTQVLGVFLPIALFILCGFEHCVANMFYFSMANVWTWQAFLYLLVMTAGNSIGGLLVPVMAKVLKIK